MLCKQDISVLNYQTLSLEWVGVLEWEPWLQLGDLISMLRTVWSWYSVHVHVEISDSAHFNATHVLNRCVHNSLVTLKLWRSFILLTSTHDFWTYFWYFKQVHSGIVILTWYIWVSVVIIIVSGFEKNGNFVQNTKLTLFKLLPFQSSEGLWLYSWFRGTAGLLLHKSHIWSCRQPPVRSGGCQNKGIERPIFDHG